MPLKNTPSIITRMSLPAFHTTATETSPSVTRLSFQNPDKSHFPIKDISLTNVISDINVDDQTNLTGQVARLKFPNISMTSHCKFKQDTEVYSKLFGKILKRKKVVPQLPLPKTEVQS